MSGVRYRFRSPRKTRERIAPPTAAPSALAMRLALAYYVERCVDDGVIANYAEAARRLGITRARMTQIMDLLLMPSAMLDEVIGANPMAT